MGNRPTMRSKQFKDWQLDKMPLNASFVLSQFEVEMLTDQAIRAHVSVINRVYHINLKAHRNEDRSMIIWHDPKPRVIKPMNPLFQDLLDTQQEYERIKAETKRKLTAHPPENAAKDLQLYGELEDKINDIIAALKQKQETWTRKNRGGMIRQPLDVVLNRLHITKEIWDLIPRGEQTRRWIAEEVKIKMEQQAAQATVTAITVPKID